MNASSTCYTIVHDDLLDTPTTQDLRNALQKGSDEVKLETMRRIIVGTLNGQSHVSSEPLVRGQSSFIAQLVDANHPIRHALQEQADQEVATLLLGVSQTSGLAEEWEQMLMS
jgi:hypothetical protein